MAELLLMTFCPGAPKTKGSMRIRNAKTGTMTEAVAGSTHWKRLMAKQFGEQRHQPEPWPGPVQVSAVFYLPRADVISVRAGDIDKLARNALDALTDAKIYTDDVNVVDLDLKKRPADSTRSPGVWLMVVGYTSAAP
jgi:Holliday junction resolvase RusA-like endonuclease